MRSKMIKSYIQLAKPGIIFGNAVTCMAGFFLASKGDVSLALLFWTLVGLSCIVGSGCVWNNYIDRAIDQKMVRTRHRALAAGTISLQKALRYGFVLGVLGVLILFLVANVLALALAAAGFFIYVVLYSFTKYHTSLCTEIGSIAGAIPPLVGYTAVSQSLDLGAWLLFLVVVLWQMPHFYAIAMYRIDEYRLAEIPVLPIVKGVDAAKTRMLVYVIAFCVTVPCLTFLGYASHAFLAVMSILSTSWLILAIRGFTAENNRLWARQMFIYSLVIIMAFSFMIIVY